MWNYLLSANRDAMRLWRNGAETMMASAYVISRRTDMMSRGTVQASPAAMGEMARMVPEKMTGFGLASLSLMDSWMKFATGSAASFPEAVDKALTPIRVRATANAKRLSRTAQG